MTNVEVITTKIVESLPDLAKFVREASEKRVVILCVTSPDYWKLEVLWGLFTIESGSKKEFRIEGNEEFVEAFMTKLRSDYGRFSIEISSDKVELEAKRDFEPKLEAKSLSDTEIEILQLVASGLTNQEIAEKLEIAKRTVDNHISNMLFKTETGNRVALVRWALQWGKVCIDEVNCCALPLPGQPPAREYLLEEAVSP